VGVVDAKCARGLPDPVRTSDIDCSQANAFGLKICWLSGIPPWSNSVGEIVSGSRGQTVVCKNGTSGAAVFASYKSSLPDLHRERTHPSLMRD